MHSRRDILRGFAGAGLMSGFRMPAVAAAEPPPETTTIRFGWSPAICVAPQYVAEELLKAEGFTQVTYEKFPALKERNKAFASGGIDFLVTNVFALITQLDEGDPIAILAGVHGGCYELFGSERVRAVRDLKGKTIGTLEFGQADHLLLSMILAYVGLDSRRDVTWVTNPPAKSMQLFAEGKIDAFMGFPPEPQELRAKKIGHLIVDTAVDRPWSEHFCCMLASNREFVTKNPVATKRAIRALLKATDVCAADPAGSARLLVGRGYTKQYDYALQTLKDVPYVRWRDYDPGASVRFYALRLHEVGMIRNNPNKILAQGTDWRFLNELKKELKG